MKKQIAAAAAALAITAGAWLPALSAHAATPQCGQNCTAAYNLLYGNTEVIGVVGATGTSASAGQPADLQSASGTNQAEDWHLLPEGTVDLFYQAGLLSAGLDLHYATDEVYEYAYAPFGVDTGYCLGTPGQAADGTAVSLQPCGQDADTLWIGDTNDQQQRMIPLITGTDTDFTYPLVLTGNNTGLNLTVNKLTGGTGIIEDGQYWAFQGGVLS